MPRLTTEDIFLDDFSFSRLPPPPDPPPETESFELSLTGICCFTASFSAFPSPAALNLTPDISWSFFRLPPVERVFSEVNPPLPDPPRKEDDVALLTREEVEVDEVLFALFAEEEALWLAWCSDIS